MLRKNVSQKKKSKIENLIRDYLLDEGILREKVVDSNLDFGFIFSFPPGGPKSQQMSVFKLKNRSFIIIAIRTKLSEKHAKTLTSLKNNKVFQFFHDLRKFFLIKEVYFRMDIQNYIYEIREQLFPKNDGYLSKNSFYKGIQKVFYCFVFSNLMLEEYCSGKEISSKKFGPEFDLSLYS